MSSAVLRPAFPSTDSDLATVTDGADLATALRLLDAIVPSVEPAVVFTSVAELCVPGLYSAASVAIREADAAAYAITRSGGPSRRGAHPADTAPVGSANLEFQGQATETHAAYAGQLVVHFPVALPSHALLAQLFVERAVAVIAQARLIEIARLRLARAEHLERALVSNREIAIAIGIIMARRHTTPDASFDLMRRISQHTHRKLRDIASDVAFCGEIEVPDGLPA